MKKSKINILSSGRFHVCDLARELDKNGFDVKFYSFVPTKRAKKFGLPKHCCASILFFMAPFLLLEKVLFPQTKWIKRMRILIQDFISGLYMRRCDILIAMSGDFLYAVKRAKRQGALIILERGSKHILEQRRILEGLPSLRGKKPVPDMNVKRELAGYKLADYIAIATQHVQRSFEKHKYPVNKLFVNPYGVDLTMFKPLPDAKKEFDILMVGGWSYQKGCDLIVEAISKTNYSFLHVGGIVDLPFPKLNKFVHVDSVDQSQLAKYYNMAKIFIFPSRQDGFGMVLSQAVACNLPIAGSKDSGAPDLKEMVEISQCIIIIDDYTPNAIQQAIEQALKKYQQLQGRIYAGKAIENLTWEAYGKRYANFLHKIIN